MVYGREMASDGDVIIFVVKHLINLIESIQNKFCF